MFGCQRGSIDSIDLQLRKEDPGFPIHLFVFDLVSDKSSLP